MAEISPDGNPDLNLSPAELKNIPHNPGPDYTLPPLEIPAEAREKMLGRLRFLYGDAWLSGGYRNWIRIM